MMRLTFPTPIVLLLLGCAGALSFPSPTPQSAIASGATRDLPSPPTGSGTPIDSGVVHEVKWSANAGLASRIWVYTPQGEKPEAGWPTILIAPAGSSQLQGIQLGEGDRAEHVAYLPHGYQVVAYEIDGIGEEDAAMEQFASSNSGLANSRHAFRYATEVLPTDPSRVFAVGHSSAGNLAMLFAAHEPGLAGVVVYNSAGDGCWAQADVLLATLSWAVPSLTEACQKGQPASHLGHLYVPMLLFASREDTVATVEDIDAVKTSNPEAPIELRILDKGDHYSSMIQAEVPQAIEWMNGRTRSR